MDRGTWQATVHGVAKSWPQLSTSTLIHTMEYYSTIKKNKIMPFSATWMDLEIVILKEVNQRKRNTIHYPLHRKSKMKQYK